MIRIMVLIGMILYLTGCDYLPKTDAQKKEIAEFACAEIRETRNFESARRVKLVNDARKKLGKGPYSMGDGGIKISIMAGNCEGLIL